MVCPAVIGSRDVVYDEDVSVVSLLGNRIVQGVSLFGLRMPPDGLLSGRELEDGIGYEKLMLSTYAEKAKPIVIAVSMLPVSDHWTSCCSIIPHLVIELTEDDQFAPWFHSFTRVKCWSVD